jgi:hypothetical protein
MSRPDCRLLLDSTSYRVANLTTLASAMGVGLKIIFGQQRHVLGAGGAVDHARIVEQVLARARGARAR